MTPAPARRHPADAPGVETRQTRGGPSRRSARRRLLGGVVALGLAAGASLSAGLGAQVALAPPAAAAPGASSSDSGRHTGALGAGTLGTALGRAVLGRPAAGGALGGAATLTDLGSAQAQAATLRMQVEDLEDQVEVAAEQHATAEQELSSVVSREIRAEHDLDVAQHRVEAAHAAAGRRARAVQRAPGGRLGLALGVLQGAQPADVLDGYHAVQGLVGADQVAEQAARTQVDDAVRASAQVQQLRRQQQTLTASTAAAVQAADAALSQRTLLLSTADAQVVALVDAGRQASEAAATAGAAAALAALGGDPDDSSATGAAAVAIAAARSKLGAPYVWGATGPDTFDCSGLVQWAYAQAGISLPRTTRQLYAALPEVPVSDLRPGDLVLYASGGDQATPATIHHVGLYTGGGLMIHAPHTGDVVRVAAVTRDDVFAVVRPGDLDAP